jgi:hypothetical protein
MNNKLYIIGNGFDLYHSMPTKYSDFKKYLETLKDAANLLYSLDNYFDGNIWGDFETAFSEFSIKEFLYDNTHLLPNVDSDRDGERYILPDCAEETVKDLTVGLYNKLNDWIAKINKIDVIGDLLPIDTSACFLTFNYTNTLERIYKINHNNILHLHGEASERFRYDNHPDYYFEQEIKDTEIIFGHSFNFKDNIKSNNKGINALVEDDAIEKLTPFFNETIKNTKEIINKNHQFFSFSSLARFDKIIIIGHSFSEIDLPYLKEIASKSTKLNECVITYYSEKELKRIQDNSRLFKCKKEYINLEFDDEILYLK